MFPPLPPWEGLHVLVVHMPIGLLVVASVFVLLASVFPRWFGTSALILLVLGTLGAWLAVATGEAARDMVEDGPDPMWEVLERHEELGELARNVFAGLTVLYAVIVLVPLVWKKAARPTVAVITNLVFLVLLLGANTLLANAAHLGGHLVHLYGVRAQLGLDESFSEEEAGSEEEEAGSEEDVAEDSSEAEPMDESAAPPDEAAETPAETPAEVPATSADVAAPTAAAPAESSTPAGSAPKP